MKVKTVKEFHRTAAILSAILETVSPRKSNFEASNSFDIDGGDACMNKIHGERRKLVRVNEPD